MEQYAFHPAADIFPLMQGEEFEALKADIFQHGQREPIILTDDGQILDGRNRYRACQALGYDPFFERWQGDDPVAYVLSLNLHRRHLTESQRAMVAARAAGLSVGRPAGNSANLHYSIEGAADTVQVSRRSAANGKRVLDKGAPELVAAVDRGEVAVSAAADVATLPRDVQQEVLIQGTVKEAVKEIREERKARSMDVHYSSETPEWYTPAHVLDYVRKAMGGITLDPCSNSHDAPNVPAEHHFTKDDDGLSRDWFGSVYMNPPYGNVLYDWIDKAASEYESGNVTQAVLLVPARTDTRWFERVGPYVRCFVKGRLKFVGSDNSAPFPSMAVYLGPDAERFAAVFSELGGVYARIDAG